MFEGELGEKNSVLLSKMLFESRQTFLINTHCNIYELNEENSFYSHISIKNEFFKYIDFDENHCFLVNKIFEPFNMKFKLEDDILFLESKDEKIAIKKTIYCKPGENYDIDFFNIKYIEIPLFCDIFTEMKGFFGPIRIILTEKKLIIKDDVKISIEILNTDKIETEFKIDYKYLRRVFSIMYLLNKPCKLGYSPEYNYINFLFEDFELKISLFIATEY